MAEEVALPQKAQELVVGMEIEYITKRNYHIKLVTLSL